MRRKISLYIAGQPIDLDDQSFILFNYTMEEMSNPTIVRNSFSQSITLKGTPNNNKVFGNIYRADRKTLFGQDSSGVQFDPARKTPFAIFNEMNEILEEGYVKLDKVSRNGVNIEYTITLYGGLGSFFYGLMYKEDGQKKTLHDLDYFDKNGRRIHSFPLQPDASSVNDAWMHLAGNATTYNNWNVLNFAPAYNGLPDGFDCKKAIYNKTNESSNLPETYVIDDKIYSAKSNAISRLMTFTNDHTEWELKDLRWYLQRPVISIKAIIDAICDKENNGGFNVILDASFFNDGNSYFKDSWMTLQMIAKDDRDSSECINNLLKATCSPAEVLISYAKIFGLIFLYNNGSKEISIVTRKTFYQQGKKEDLTDRVDISSMEITPLVADSLIYQFGDKAVGQFAEEYRKEYQREYGIQKVNTGYEFNADTKVLTKDIKFIDSVDVMEFNRMFTSGRIISTYNQQFLLPAFESVTAQLWNGSGESEDSIDLPVTAVEKDIVFDNDDYPYGDWMPKVQLHNKNKQEDGGYTLLFFTGVKETPSYGNGIRKKYMLTNDHVDMVTLNQGTPCWNLTGEGFTQTSLPSFRRNIVSSVDGSVDYSWEWGAPLAVAVPGMTEENRIYDRWWKKYLSDLYDVDTRIMKCKVNLSGLLVNQALMSNTFWYGGAFWRLNKIINHSLTTWDNTECEFIKIKDINNYIG